MNFGPIALIVAAMVAASFWVMAALAIQAYLASLARYRAWQVRDDIINDVLKSHLPRDCDLVNDLIYITEWLIRCADKLGVVQLTMGADRRRDDTEADRSERQQALARMPAHQRKRLERREFELLRVLRMNILFGTLFSSILAALVISVATVTAGLRNLFRRRERANAPSVGPEGEGKNPAEARLVAPSNRETQGSQSAKAGPLSLVKVEAKEYCDPKVARVRASARLDCHRQPFQDHSQPLVGCLN